MNKIAVWFSLVLLTLNFGCVTQSVRAENSERRGTAEGFLNANGENMPLAFAYAVEKKGQVSVILSDKPVPTEALENQKLLTELGSSGEVSAMKVVIEYGRVAAEVFFFDRRLPSGISVEKPGPFTPKRVDDEMLSGVLVMDDPGFSFGYRASFSAPIFRPAEKKPVSVGPNASVADRALAALKNKDIDFDEDTFRSKVQDGDDVAVKLFLDAGMPAEIYGRPAIAEAVQLGRLEVTQVLIDYGADVNYRDDYGESLVLRAASMGKLPILEALIRAGADVNAPNVYRTTPLDVAAEQGDIMAVRLLLKAGAKVNARSASGGTALQVAVLRGYVDIVKLLIASGADVARDREDLLEIARREKHKDVEKLILKVPKKNKK